MWPKNTNRNDVQQSGENQPVQSEHFDQERPIIGILNEHNPDELTPKQALELLYQLKAAIKDRK